MAYLKLIGQNEMERGPYPNLAGEYCGNHIPGSPAFPAPGQTPAEADEMQKRYLARMRFGRPRGCVAGTSEEMAARGYVGLYLLEDSPFCAPFPHKCIPTPPELMEPDT